MLADCTKEILQVSLCKHSDKPLKAWIVFSKGFHDSWVLSPLHKEKLSIFLLCNLPIKVMEPTFWHPNRNRNRSRREHFGIWPHILKQNKSKIRWQSAIEFYLLFLPRRSTAVANRNIRVRQDRSIAFYYKFPAFCIWKAGLHSRKQDRRECWKYRVKRHKKTVWQKKTTVDKQTVLC